MDQPVTMVNHPSQRSLRKASVWPTLLLASIVILAMATARPASAQSPPADLAFSLDDTPDPVAPGGLLIYTLTAHNLGPAPATDIFAGLGLPSHTTFCAADPRCTVNGSITCRPGALGVEETMHMPLTFMVAPTTAVTTSIGVSGFDTGGTSDPFFGNNGGTEATTINGGEMLGLVVEPATVNVAPNSTQTFTAFGCPIYTLGTSEVGLDGTPGTEDDECVPAAVEWAVSGDIGTVTPSTGPTTTLTPGSTFATGAVIANACLFSAFASITIAQPPMADLAVTKEDAPDPVPLGADLTYTIVVTNNGPDDATNVKLFDQLPLDIPAPVTFVSAMINPPAERTCAFVELPPGIPTVGCELGTLPANTSVLVTIVVQVTLDADDTLFNQVEVFADQHDPDLQNNAVEALTTVLACKGRIPTIIGTDNPDFLVGTPGPDVIHGLGGTDVIFGNGGNDLICGGVGNDFLFGNDGKDELLGQAGSDRLEGGDNHDILIGGTDGDALIGGDGNDTLRGGEGNDNLVGNDGKDTFSGGDGTLDTCEGGDGKDAFEESVPGDNGGCEFIFEIP